MRNNHSRNVTIALLALAFCAGSGYGYMSHTGQVHHGTAQPRRDIVRSNIIKPRQRRRVHRYIFYKDFTRRRAWVSQRSHGRFTGSTCEAASLLTGLRLEGLMERTNLYHFVRDYVGYPDGNRHANPNISYNRNPYLHHGASVYSRAIAKAAQRAGSKAAIIDGVNPSVIVRYLKEGHPVYVEAGHHMQTIYHGKISDHTMILSGIREDTHGNIQVKFMDPNVNSYRKATGWCSIQQFLVAWQRYITGERAVVLLGRELGSRRHPIIRHAHKSHISRRSRHKMRKVRHIVKAKNRLSKQ